MLFTHQHDRSISTVLIEHGNAEPLEFNIDWAQPRYLPVDGEGRPIDIFREINHYISTLPKTTQDEIFGHYSKVMALFRNTMHEQSVLLRELQPIMADICKLFPDEDLMYYIKYSSENRIILPSLPTHFTPEMVGTPEKTYLSDEYRQLVVLSLKARVFTPVWGEYLHRIDGEVTNVFKDYNTMALSSRSHFYHSPAMERLRVYTRASIGSDYHPDSGILKGLSSEDIPDWVTSMLVIRKLSTADISGREPGPVLAKYMYRAVTSKLKNRTNDKAFVGRVKHKAAYDDSGNSDESKISVIEGFRARQDISRGNVAVFNHAASRPLRMAKDICPDIPHDLVFEAVEATKSLQNVDVRSPQIILTQTMIAASISPKALLYLDSAGFLNCIAVATACLWHMGHRDLALLCSAFPYGEPAIDQRHRIPADLEQRLESLYPYARRPVERETPHGRNVKRRHKNAAVALIEELNNSLSNFRWQITAPVKWLLETPQYRDRSESRLMDVPPDVKIKLAQLAIEIAMRQNQTIPYSAGPSFEPPKPTMPIVFDDPLLEGHY